MSSGTWPMSAPESTRLATSRLAGVLDFGPSVDRNGTWGALGHAIDGSEQEIAALGPLIVGHAGGLIHRQRDVLCAFEGRMANVGALAHRLGCRPDLPPARIAAVAYDRLGESFVEQMRGEFVVVVWDFSTMSGLIARDPLGGRTVFTHQAGSRLTFATDLRWLIRLLPTRPDVDSIGLVEWLMLGGTLGGGTLYAGVRRLEPGTSLLMGPDGCARRTNWRPHYATPLEIPREEAAAELSAALVRSVGSRIAGASAVGVLLSGGLDSTAVGAVAREVIKDRDVDLVGYSMTFPHNPEIDESSLINAVSDHLRIPSVQMRISGGSVLAGGLDFLRAWELPCAAPNAAFTTALQRHAVCDGVRLMLDGEGGDELFGADPYLAATYVRRGQLSAAWSLCRQVPGIGSAPRCRDIARAFKLLALRGAVPYWLSHRRRALRSMDELAPAWLASWGAKAFAGTFDPWIWKRSPAPLWWAHLARTLTWSREELWLCDYLRQLGAISGLDRRHPLLDVELVELALRLPPQYAYDPRFDRALLRHSMKDRLPPSVTGRAGKSYFTGLLRQSLLREDLPVVRRLIGSPKAEIRGFVDPHALAVLLDLAASATEPPEFAIYAWRLAMAECWLQSVLDTEYAEKMLESTALAPPRIEFTTRTPKVRPVGLAAA